jgi:hypothetical protein
VAAARHLTTFSSSGKPNASNCLIYRPRKLAGRGVHKYGGGQFEHVSPKRNSRRCRGRKSTGWVTWPVKSAAALSPLVTLADNRAPRAVLTIQNRRHAGSAFFAGTTNSPVLRKRSRRRKVEIPFSRQETVRTLDLLDRFLPRAPAHSRYLKGPWTDEVTDAHIADKCGQKRQGVTPKLQYNATRLSGRVRRILLFDILERTYRRQSWNFCGAH